MLMNRIRNIWTALVLAMGLCMQAYAQLEVRLDGQRRDYILGENVMLKVTIINHMDTAVGLSSTPGRCWLNLQVTRRGSALPEPAASIPNYPSITIPPGSSRAYNIELKPHFSLSKEGSYSVIATLRLPDMKTTYSSNTAVFNMIAGANMRSFTVQVRGQKLRLGLKTLNIGGKDLLFGQVMNIDTRQPVGACYMGQFLNFMEPRVALDKAQNMHMLCQSTAEFFTYSVMDTYGKRRDYKIMKRTGGPVDLVSSGGGIRCIGLAPYSKSKKPKEQYHNASERP